MDKFGIAAGLLIAVAAVALPAAAFVVAPAVGEPTARSSAAGAVLGSDAAACRAGAAGPAALVHVHGFKDSAGELRVQLYSDSPDDFLVSGRKLRRIELPVSSEAAMDVCIALPSAGRFALAVLHDRDSDDKLSIWRDGVGFSNNPKIVMGKPDVSEVAFDAGRGLAQIDVVLNYRSGFGIRPIASR